MAKTPTGEFFSTLKGYFNALTEGERTPTEVASALNEWARESAESIKSKISEEVEIQVAKMGFIKRDEYDALLTRVATLEKKSAKAKTSKVSATKKSEPAKKVIKKATAKKASK
jgi:BMFP domain-containing protein YqiC